MVCREKISHLDIDGWIRFGKETSNRSGSVIADFVCRGSNCQLHLKIMRVPDGFCPDFGCPAMVHSVSLGGTVSPWTRYVQSLPSRWLPQYLIHRKPTIPIWIQSGREVTYLSFRDEGLVRDQSRSFRNSAHGFMYSHVQSASLFMIKAEPISSYQRLLPHCATVLIHT